jgi:hypothetical protein
MTMTDAERQIMRLRQAIERERRWATSQANDCRACSLHLARVEQYRAELAMIENQEKY